MIKLIVAERLTIIVNQIFNNINDYSGFYMLIGAIAFSLQIYCDFMSYSEIALGLAEILGFDIIQNFRRPYLACSITDFWRRWHISLSTWFRDYLYIPLGGNRCYKIKKYRNIMIIFLISGLWHGANWTYVFWGGLNGIFQIVGSLLQPVRDLIVDTFDIDRKTFSHQLLKKLITFGLATFAWIFFRADTISAAITYIKRMFLRWNPWILVDGSLVNLGLDTKNYFVLFIMLIIILVVSILQECGIDIKILLFKQGLWFRFLLYFLGIFAVIILGVYGFSYNASQFIYFQF